MKEKHTVADNTCDRHTPSSPLLSRRRCLQLVGTAATIGAVGVTSSGKATAAPNYTVVELSAGETFQRDIESNETFEDTLIDATADGAEVRIDASGSNWTVRNVGIKGQLTSRDLSVFRLQVSEGATGTFENIYLGDGAVDGGYGGVFVPTTHEGTLRMSEVNVQYWPDNGKYASAPGRAERGGRGGLVEIERSYARNNNVAGFRLGSDRSEVRDSVVHVDSDIPANAAGKVNARGIWVKEGGSIEIEDSDILLEHPDGTYGVLEGDDNSVGLARVIDSEVAVRDGADGRFRGNVETSNVGSDPVVSRPQEVPATAKEAAVGQNFSNDAVFAGGSDTDLLEYTLETTGEVAGTRSTEAGDTVSGGRASGATGGSKDIFRYSGAISTLNASLPNNDSIAEVTISRVNDRIEFDGGEQNTARLDYYVRVTGSIEPLSAEFTDTISGNEAKGSTTKSFQDAYTYTGKIAAFRVRLPESGDQLSIDIRTPN